MWDYMFGRHLNGGSLMGPDLPRSSSSTFIWRGVVGSPAARHAGMWRTWYQLSHQSAPKSIRSWATHNTTYKAALSSHSNNSTHSSCGSQVEELAHLQAHTPVA
jgi:hypothetical protein